jgi:hypothetical protein
MSIILLRSLHGCDNNINLKSFRQTPQPISEMSLSSDAKRLYYDCRPCFAWTTTLRFTIEADQMSVISSAYSPSSSRPDDLVKLEIGEEPTIT